MTELERLALLTPPEGVLDAVLDTDAYNEIDDQFAIVYALMSPERLNVQALYAAPFWNELSSGPADGMEKSYHEMIKIRDFVDPEGKMNIPCYRGSEDYMPNIITPVKSEAAENIVRLVHETDGIVYVAALGAFTNVASALMLDPSIMKKMVVILVGANSFEHVDCNEFNLAQNRSAARVIFECGVPVIVLPAMGGTQNITTTNAELTFYLRDKAGKLGNYLCDIMNEAEGNPEEEGDVCVTKTRIIWDIAAIAVIRGADEWTGLKVVPAKTITADGKWRDLCSGKNMIYGEWFRRCAIMSDFYTVIRQGGLK